MNNPMNVSNRQTKLTLTLLRIRGKRQSTRPWTTSQNTHILGKEHPLFAGEATRGAYVDDNHVQIYFEEGRWYIKNLSSELNLTLDGQALAHKAPHLLTHDSVFELGLCQIHVTDHQHVEARQALQQMLLLNEKDPEQNGSLIQNDFMLNDPQKGLVLTIAAQNLAEKTTFEDMGLGLHFDEQQFFKEIQSESAHIRTLQATAKKESLDILDQLAIESEIAIINPSLLNKNVDYWQNTPAQNFAPDTEIPELEHLFALKDYHGDHMVPLDNLEHINDLLVNKDNIDKVIGRLDDVDEYALFESEQRVEPLRLFSLENHDIRDYAVQNTPEFTQKEHHSSSMDSYFNVPSTETKVNRSKPDTQKNGVNDDDWLNNFGASLNDKVSADDILDALTSKSNHK